MPFELEEISLGNIKVDIQKVYPELEDLQVTPSGVEKDFKSKKYGYSNVKVKAIEIKERYLEGYNLILVLSDNSKLSIDISEYIGTTELTQEQINAINNMNVSIENGEIMLDYDDKVLAINFSLKDGNLIVDDNLNGADFNINENGEMEVLY